MWICMPNYSHAIAQMKYWYQHERSQIEIRSKDTKGRKINSDMSNMNQKIPVVIVCEDLSRK